MFTVVVVEALTNEQDSPGKSSTHGLVRTFAVFSACAVAF